MSAQEIVLITHPEASSRNVDFRQYADDFSRDGVVVIRNGLNEAEMALIERAFEERLARPEETGGVTERLFPNDKAIVLSSIGNSATHPLFAEIIAKTAIADIAQGIFGGRATYYWGEQLWMKEGGNARRTSWHQDTSYLPVDGENLAVLWIPLDSLEAVNVLEVVRGSHRGPLYNASIFDENDDTAPLYDEKDLPRLPLIEAERHKWDIVGQDMKRGDVLVFHPGCLHGGAPTSPGQRRRSMSFRFFDDRAVFSPRPQIKGDHNNAGTRDQVNKENNYAGFEMLKPGDFALESSAFLRVRNVVSGR